MMMSEESFKFLRGWKMEKGSTRDIRFSPFMKRKCTSGETVERWMKNRFEGNHFKFHPAGK
jgi:hypothetical protein